MEETLEATAEVSLTDDDVQTEEMEEQCVGFMGIYWHKGNIELYVSSLRLCSG